MHDVEPPTHLSPDDFRDHAADLVNLILDYQQRIARDAPVRSSAQPGDVLRALPREPPSTPEAWSDVLDDVRSIIIPGLTNWQSPSFFGYFPANASEPAILADLLCAGLAVQGMLWQTSPACTELETRVLDWLASVIGLPKSFMAEPPGAETGRGASGGGGVIHGTASEAVLVAMHAARTRAVRHGADPTSLVAYCSDQAHFSVTKAAMITGLGEHAVRTIPSDRALAMDPRALVRTIDEDVAAGRTPFFIVATLGTTSTGAIDPLDAIARATDHLAHRWLHVDAAWAGAALVCPEHRPMIRAVEHADSFNFNPHKWLLTNFDCSTLWVRDRAALTNSLSITTEYIRNAPSDSGAVIDYRDWQIPLGRRFRALKLWFVMRLYGVEGLRRHIRHHVALATELESLIRADDRFEMPLPRSLALLTFRLREGNTATAALVERLNASGKVFLTPTTVPVGPDRAPTTLARVAIGATRTVRTDVLDAWTLIRAEADRAP